MSRVGKRPIPIPEKTEISYKDRLITVKGTKGTLTRSIHPSVDLKIDKDVVNVTIFEENKNSGAFQGLVRSLVANMIQGVSNGFERVLEINGIGYRAELKGSAIVFNLGYSHPINFDLPKGIEASIDRNSVIKLNGIDKELLGHTAAAIRKLRPPEPYKGKGIKYAEENIRKKAGKTGTTA
jgi:large subunit ribosomal protein L6